ncbi:MAG: Uma2 family endonuclease [Lachnospiraceae bacterium]
MESNHGSCEVYPAPFAVFLNKDDKTYAEPDISIIGEKDKLSDRGCEGASPTTQKRDYGIKLFKYRAAGVREYWIVNPAKEIVNVYNFEAEEDCNLYSFDDPIPSGIYPGFFVCIRELL